MGYYDELKKIGADDLKALKGRAGIYWTATQPKEDKAKILLRRVKNYSVSNLYGLIANSLNVINTGTVPAPTNINFYTTSAQVMDWQATASTSGVSGGTAALIGLYTGANSGAFKTVMSAGTDTTTATTASMADIVTPASPIRDSNTFSFTNIGLSMAGIQWQGNFLAGSFGVGGTTAIGEFGLEVRMFGSVGSVYIWALMNRLAVADANTGFTSPINVSNTNPFNITITLVI